MKLIGLLSLIATCCALSLPSFLGGTSTSTPSSPYQQAQYDMNRQDGQWIWVPNSALRDIVNTNSYSSSGYNSNSNSNSRYQSPYNTNSFYNNRQTTTTYSSLFGK